MTATTQITQADATAIANELGYKVEVHEHAADCWDVRLYWDRPSYNRHGYNRRRDVGKAQIGDRIMKMLAEMTDDEPTAERTA